MKPDKSCKELNFLDSFSIQVNHVSIRPVDSYPSELVIRVSCLSVAAQHTTFSFASHEAVIFNSSNLGK